MKFETPYIRVSLFEKEEITTVSVGGNTTNLDQALNDVKN